MTNIKKYPEWRDASSWLALDGKKLDEGLKEIQDEIDQIPPESRADAYFSEAECGGVRIEWKRPENERERNLRLSAELAKESRERAELARLKAKYEGAVDEKTETESNG